MDLGAAVLGGVLHEVGEHLLHLVRVGVHAGQVRREHDGAVELGDRHAHLLHHGASQGGEIDHLPAQHQTAGLQAADVEQLGDEPGHPIGVVVDLLEHGALLLVLRAGPSG